MDMLVGREIAVSLALLTVSLHLEFSEVGYQIGNSFLCFENWCMSMDLIWGTFRCQVTIAHLKDKPAPSTPTGTSSSSSASSGFRSATARLLGGGNGNRALSFVGGNGGNKNVNTNARIGASFTASSSSTSATNTNFDGKGSYLVFNVGDAIFISDLNSQDKVFYFYSFYSPKT